MSISKLKPFDKIEIIRKCIGMTSTQKLLLLVLSSHLGKQNFCYLSLTTLQKETCLSRTSISDNLRLLVLSKILWQLPPSNGYKSNRYGINFELIVVQDYQCSSLGLLDQSPRTTRLVVQGYPKRKLNKIEKKKKEELLSIQDKKSKEKTADFYIGQAIKACGGVRKSNKTTGDKE
jgi:hypothetical protein